MPTQKKAMLVKHLGEHRFGPSCRWSGPWKAESAEEKDQVSSFLGTRFPSRMLVIDEITPINQECSKKCELCSKFACWSREAGGWNWPYFVALTPDKDDLECD